MSGDLVGSEHLRRIQASVGSLDDRVQQTERKLSPSFTALSSDTTLTTGASPWVPVSTASGAVTITLPASPVVGTEFTFVDVGGSASTNAITIARNGNTINGAASNYTFDVSYGVAVFVYASSGWVGYTPAERNRPHPYYASMYLANSGSPTHTSLAGWQKVGSGGGVATWASEYDIRPSGVSAQVDTSTNKRIDIRKTGVYLVTASVYFNSIIDGRTVGSGAYVNGVLQLGDVRQTGRADSIYVQSSAPLVLSSGDYVELYAFQDDSVSEAYSVGRNSFTRLTTTYLGPSS